MSTFKKENHLKLSLSLTRSLSKDLILRILEALDIEGSQKMEIHGKS